MKIDELIKNRKDKLDVETPPQEVWKAIKEEIRPIKSTSFQWWKVAAIIFVSLSIGLLIQNRLLQSQVDELATLGDISDEYQRIENNYLSQVNLLEGSIPLDELKEDADYTWVFEELVMLEEINTMYRADIGKVSEQQLVAVLIDYYEKKLNLLKTLELEIKRNSNKNDNEKTTTDHIRI